MPEQSDVGKMPWEMDWNPTVSKLADTASTALEGISATVNAAMPWNMDWGGKRKVDTTPIQPTQTQPTTPQFDNVFSNLIKAESRGVHAVNGQLTTSPVGAQGITQLMPATAKNPGFGIQGVKDQSEGEYLRVGKQYLQALVNEFSGDYRKAVAAYNAGIGNVQKAIKKGGENWEAFLPKKSETLPYLEKVLGAVTGSRNANAAADFSNYLTTDTNKTTGKVNYTDNTYEFSNNRTGAEAVKLIQDKFPQFASNVNTKITAEQAGPMATAEYGGLSGDVIKAGKLVRGSGRKFDKNGNPLPLDEYDQRDVNGFAATLMHELQHARMSGIQRFDTGLGDNWRDMIKEAGDLGFPSVSSTVGGGDKLNEFLSTATVIHEFRKAGIKLTDNTFGPLVTKLEGMEKKYPWLRQYIVEHIQPEALNAGGKKASAEQRQVPKYERKK